MPEAGGTSNQAGIFYQNSVAALAIAELLDLDPRPARERVLEVRLEAPECVDDIVVTFADGHHEYRNVKSRVSLGSRAWSGIWRDFSSQRARPTFTADDRLVLVIGHRNGDSESTAELCDRAYHSVDVAELLDARLNRATKAVFKSVSAILGGHGSAFELLRRVDVLHLHISEIESELARRRLAGAVDQPPILLPILRDLAGGVSRRRGMFRAGPLRLRLKNEYSIVLSDPPDWGLFAYRHAVRELCRIAVPGLYVSGLAKELFVWPRARSYDRSRLTDFEDETLTAFDLRSIETVDLRTFPNDKFNRVIVVAGPGYGKTALLTAIADDLVSGPLVPVQVSLSAFAETKDSVLAFLATTTSREMDLKADWRLLAEQGLLVLLFDGLDEVPANERPHVLYRLKQYSALYPRSPWMLTVRDAAVVSGLAEATTVELLPLDYDDIGRFIEAMKKHVDGLDAARLFSRLRSYPDLDRLARIPLFLTMLLATSSLESATVLTRADLIETYLRTLFAPARHKKVRDVTDRSVQLRQIAEKLAFDRLERQEIGAAEREVHKIIAAFGASPEDESVLYSQLVENGILKAQGVVRLQFPYPIVQEYLAAHHLVEHHPETLSARIDDAVQRPWAQVLQFALELHPAPEPVIRTMLAKPEDAFCTGLRLVGHCIVNGAKVSSTLRREVCDRLVEFWVRAPTRARERVGRLLSEGFADLRSPALVAALEHIWLLNDGAGEIICKLADPQLTCRIISKLIKHDRSSIRIYHSLQPALELAGDRALKIVVDAVHPDVCCSSQIEGISSLFYNFKPGSVSRELAMSVALDDRVPAKVRLRAFRLAGAPVDQAGIALAIHSLRQHEPLAVSDACDVLGMDNDLPHLLPRLLKDNEIPLQTRREIVGRAGRYFPDPAPRHAFLGSVIDDESVEGRLRAASRLVAARYGDRCSMETMIGKIGVSSSGDSGIAISLFGYFPDKALGEHAANLARRAKLTSKEKVLFAHSATTGMNYIFEMDFALSGGGLRFTSPHPAIDSWRALIEDWSVSPELTPRDRLSITMSAAELGSEQAHFDLETLISGVADFDAPEWMKEDEYGHAMSSALHQLQRRAHLPAVVVERILASKRYNIAARAVDALQAAGTADALDRLIRLQSSEREWHLRDTAANAIELLAGRLSMTICEIPGGYVLGGKS